MLKYPIIFLLAVIFWIPSAGGQELSAGPAYQMLLMNNPGLTGSTGRSTLRLACQNYFPGNGFNLNSFHFSWDSFSEALHGGTGLYISDDYLGGIINDIRGGFSYAYFLKAGPDLFINAGLSASVFHRGYNFSSAILPDQIDPVAGATLPTAEILGERGKTLLDLAAGFIFSSGKFTGGFAINHLAQPEIASSALYTERLRRRYTFHLAYDPGSSGNSRLRPEPLLNAYFQGHYACAGAGAALETGHLALNAMVFGDNGKNVNIQTGFSFSYSSVSLYYNYRLNAVSGNSLLPLSLLHEVGLALSLNNVEKRKEFKTINFPKM
jgi:type IX secretion system PorP/SprF family membrane protein